MSAILVILGTAPTQVTSHCWPWPIKTSLLAPSHPQRVTGLQTSPRMAAVATTTGRLGQRLGQRLAGVHPAAAFSGSAADGDPMGSLLELRSTLGKQNVKWLLPSYVDMHGVSKSKVVPLSHMMNMMGGSEMYTGAALDGVVRLHSNTACPTHRDLCARGL